MDEWTRKVQATVRRWWWAIGSSVVAFLVGGCCPVVAYGPPPKYGPPTLAPLVLYGPPPTVIPTLIPVKYGPPLPTITPGAFILPTGLPGELLSLLYIAAFAVVGIIWLSRPRGK